MHGMPTPVHASVMLNLHVEIAALTTLEHTRGVPNLQAFSYMHAPT